MPRLIVSLLLALALSLTPAAAQRPPPDLPRAQVVFAGGKLTAFWDAPDGQALVCVIHRPSRAPLEPCLRGPGGLLRLAVPRDVGLQVEAGDLVDVRAYGAGGALLGERRVAVADEWRYALPVAGR